MPVSSYQNRRARATSGNPEGVRWILIRPDGSKRPAWENFQKLYPSEEKVAEHLAKGWPIAIEPASLGLVVLDCDVGDPAALIADYPPLITVPSGRPGRYHVYYVKPPGSYYNNGNWQYGGAGGQIRHRGGVLIIYHERPHHLVEQLALLRDTYPDRTPPPFSELRAFRNEKPPPTPPDAPPLNEAELPDDAREVFQVFHLTRRPMPRVPKGFRNPWIKEMMYAAARIGGNADKTLAQYRMLARALGRVTIPPMDTEKDRLELLRLADWIYSTRNNWIVEDENGNRRVVTLTTAQIKERNIERSRKGGKAKGKIAIATADKRARIAQGLKMQGFGASEIARRMTAMLKVKISRRTVSNLLRRNIDGLQAQMAWDAELDEPDTEIVSP